MRQEIYFTKQTESTVLQRAEQFKEEARTWQWMNQGMYAPALLGERSSLREKLVAAEQDFHDTNDFSDSMLERLEANEVSLRSELAAQAQYLETNQAMCRVLQDEANAAACVYESESAESQELSHKVTVARRALKRSCANPWQNPMNKQQIIQTDPLNMISAPNDSCKDTDERETFFSESELAMERESLGVLDKRYRKYREDIVARSKAAKEKLVKVSERKDEILRRAARWHSLVEERTLRADAAQKKITKANERCEEFKSKACKVEVQLESFAEQIAAATQGKLLAEQDLKHLWTQCRAASATLAMVLAVMGAKFNFLLW